MCQVLKLCFHTPHLVYHLLIICIPLLVEEQKTSACHTLSHTKLSGSSSSDGQVPGWTAGLAHQTEASLGRTEPSWPKRVRGNAERVRWERSVVLYWKYLLRRWCVGSQGPKTTGPVIPNRKRSPEPWSQKATVNPDRTRTTELPFPPSNWCCNSSVIPCVGSNREPTLSSCWLRRTAQVIGHPVQSNFQG